MRVVFVNRFYWPDEPATAQLLTDLAEGLAAQGHEIVVVASRPPRAGVPAEEIRQGVRIVRVASPRAPNPTLPAKARDFGTFWLGACWRIFRLARRDTLVVALTDPPLLGVGAWAMSRMRGARLLHWVQDIYPELAIELAGQRWLRLLRPLRNAAWRGACLCVTLGTDMAAALAEAGVAATRIRIVPNWAPAGLTAADETDVAALRAAWKLTGKFVVAYSGNLGRVHDLEPVVAAADALRAVPEIAFVFIGDGAQRAALENEVRRRGLTNVLFFPAQPRARLAASLGVADVHLVTLRPGCERLVFPSKLYGIAAIGRPIVFVGSPASEIARLVQTHGLGDVAPRDDRTALVTAIRQFAAEPARAARARSAALQFAASHTADAAVAAWDRLLRTCGDPDGVS